MSLTAEDHLSGPAPSLPFHRLLDEAPVGIFATDAEGVTTWVNRHWCELSGLAAERALGKGWLEAIHPADRQAVASGWEAAVRSGEPSDGDYRFLHPDGRIVQVHGRANPDRDEDGRLLGWIGTITDVTARLEAEAMIAIQRDVLELVVSGAPLQSTLDLLLRFVEKRHPDMLASILLLDDSRRRVEPIAAPSLPVGFTDAIAGQEIGPDAGSCGTAAYLGMEVITSDIATDPRWARYRDLAASHDLRACWSTPVFDRDGLVLGTFALYFREPRSPGAHHRELITLITDLAALAITRARDLRILRDNEQEFRAFFDQAAFGVAVMSSEGRYLQVNHRFSEIVGVPVEQIIDKPLGLLGVPSETQENAASLRKLVQGSDDLYRGEHRIRRPDGSVRIIVATGTTVRSPDGEVRRLVVVIEDVTASRKLEQQLRQSQKLEAIGMLAGGVAHDFNNLLSIVLGHAEMASHALGPDHPVRADLDAITESAQHGAAVTRQLLAFARRELSPPKPIDLNRRIGEMERMLARLIRADITLTTDLDQDLWPVLIDPTQFDQVLINLVTNARDAIDGPGTIHISTGNQDGNERMVVVRVRDTGIGMSDETRSQILQPFFTTKARGLGTGLGLPVVVGIVEQAGGRVSVESELGTGSEVTLLFPRTELPVTDAPELGVGGVPTESGPVATILLVEDEAPLLHLQRRTLERAGFRVLAAGTGRQALDLVEHFSEPITLLLTDVVMPGMNGPELAAEITARFPEIKVLYMSGYPADVVTAQGELPATIAYLQKPFTATELVSEVNSLLGD